MKVRCINNKDCEKFLSINKIYNVFYDDCDFNYKIKDDLGINCNLSKERFEIIEEKESDNMEKTFQEVINDGKKNETWEDENTQIFIGNNEISIISKNGEEYNGFVLKNNAKFKLQRKEYDFIEAFTAYQKGKEIESLESKLIYKKVNNKNYFKENYNDKWFKCAGTTFNEINNKWYIND